MNFKISRKYIFLLENIAHVCSHKVFTISVQTFEILNFFLLQSPGNFIFRTGPTTNEQTLWHHYAVPAYAYTSLNNFSSASTRPRDMLFLLKDTLSIENEKCSRDANLFVCSPEPLQVRYPHPKCENLTIEGICLVSCIY